MKTFSTKSAVLSAALFLGVRVLSAQSGANPPQTEVPREEAVAGSADGAGASQVRIVRLSLVQGQVQLDRNTGKGFEAAFANIPIVAGAKLRTRQGVAEIEFEDNSTLRLAPETVVIFGQLSRMVSGETVSKVNMVQGMAYASLAKTKGDVFTLAHGDARVVLSPGAHVRLEAGAAEAKLTVFEGEAQLEMASGAVALMKKDSVSFTADAQTPPSPVHKTQEAAYDDWDKQQQDYHKRATAFVGSNGLYGSNDLNYYGQFQNMAGCGSLWRPYFASAGWDPFANGTWAWYPTAGYSWVSPYPWGWLPYHSGNWVSCGAAGWGWQPGGQWYGLQNVTAMRLSKGFGHSMPAPPLKNAATLVPVNTKPLAVSGAIDTETFRFQKDSAGVGVPRQTFGELRSASSMAQRSGFASSSYSVRPTGASGGGQSTSMGAFGNSGYPAQRGLPGSGTSSMSRSSSASSAPSISPSSPAGSMSTASGGAHH